MKTTIPKTLHLLRWHPLAALHPPDQVGEVMHGILLRALLEQEGQHDITTPSGGAAAFSLCVGPGYVRVELTKPPAPEPGPVLHLVNWQGLAVAYSAEHQAEVLYEVTERALQEEEGEREIQTVSGVWVRFSVFVGPGYVRVRFSWVLSPAQAAELQAQREAASAAAASEMWRKGDERRAARAAQEGS